MLENPRRPEMVMLPLKTISDDPKFQCQEESCGKRVISRENIFEHAWRNHSAAHIQMEATLIMKDSFLLKKG